jgi:hypothetical protein
MKPRVLKFKQQEKDFAKQISELGAIYESSEQQDMFEHWDIKLENKFDVKAIKRVRTAEGEPDDNIHYIEFVNLNGELGWLYGKSDYIAFELNDYWLIVDRKILVLFAQSKCASKETCQTPELYKIYSRGKDKMTLARTIDLIYISELLLPKNKTNETT